jgi:IS1 family transposase
MDWETRYCPNRRCRFYGDPLPQSRLVNNGSSHGQPQAWCRACGQSVTVRYGTAYWDVNAEPAICEMAIRALAEGHALRSTARMVHIDQDTACDWLDRAAQHGRKVLRYLWRDVPVTACQLDELWSVVHTKESHLAMAKRVCETSGDAWMWMAYAPVWRLVLACVVGKRTQERANRLRHRVAPVTAQRLPWFTSDQWPEYRTALRHVYGQWVQPARHGNRGRFPAPRRVPPPDVLDAQVVTHRRRGHIVGVTTTAMFGTPDAIAGRLAALPTSTPIHTSDVEREHLTWRQHHRRLTRQTHGLSQEWTGREKPRWLSLASEHLVLPHERVRRRLRAPEATRGQESKRRWNPMTPAMAAGITEHVWTTPERLSYRVPAAFLDKLQRFDHVFPAIKDTHQGS